MNDAIVEYFGINRHDCRVFPSKFIRISNDLGLLRNVPSGMPIASSVSIMGKRRVTTVEINGLPNVMILAPGPLGVAAFLMVEENSDTGFFCGYI